MTEEEGDQQASDASVAVEEWVNRFELDVREPGPQEGGQAVILGVEEAFELSHGI